MLFLDEIHRFNKAQQDALLPAVEEGLVTLIGATTENPYFEVNSALISRVRVYELQPLSADERRGAAAAHRHRGRPTTRSRFLAERSERRRAGRARRAGDRRRGRRRPIGVEEAETALQRRAIRYDKAADQHYDYASAWIKATRGSDPDASLYYLAVMIEGGEDPRFIARRMVILASEDIGNADPQALVVAVAAAQAVEHVGHARGRARAGPGRRLPVARAEVERGVPRARRGARARPRARRRAAARAPALALPRRRRLRLPARPARATSRRRSSCPTRSPARGSTSPTRPRRRMAERLERIRAARGGRLGDG